MAVEEKKGPKVSDLKARLGLKPEGGATLPPGGATLPPGMPAPGMPAGASPLVAPPGAAPLVAPPGAAPLVAPPGAAPLVAPPGMAPLVAPPGVDLPQPPQPEPAAASSYYAPEPEPYYDEPGGNIFEEEPEQKPNLGKSLWWVKFAIPSAVVGLAVGLYLGIGAYASTYNDLRRVPAGQIQESFEGLSVPMAALTERVLALKEAEVDVKFSEDITGPLSQVNLFSPDALKQYTATFLQADTLRLLHQYQFLTRNFFDYLRDHQRTTEKTKADLLAAKASKLSQPRYAVVYNDNTDQGGIILGQLCILIGDPKIEVKDEPEPVDEEDPNAVKAPPKMIKATYKTYKLKNNFAGEPFERTVRVQSDGSETVREITNINELIERGVIPSYQTALLFDYAERIKNLKRYASNIQKVQAELKAALDADVARQITFF